MARKKQQFFVSLECLSTFYFAVFVVLLAVSFLVPFLMLYFRGEKSITSLSFSLDQSDSLLLQMQINSQLQTTNSIDNLHIENFKRKVVSWSFTDPRGLSGEGFRTMLFNAISTFPQFEFIYLNYEYLPSTFGFCGWYGPSKFYYTNMTGYTGVFPSEDGQITWEELYGFWDNANNTNSAWVAPILKRKAPTWTLVYPAEYQVTGVDLYATFGNYFESDSRRYIFSIDLNLKSLNSLLRNGTWRGGLAYVVECETGYLIGSSVDAPLYTKTVNQDGISSNLLLVPAVSSSHPAIAASSAFLLSATPSFSAIGSSAVTFSSPDGEFFLSTTPYSTPSGINWMIVSLTPTDYYLGDIRRTRLPAIIVPVLVVLSSLALGFFGTILIVTRRFVVYRSSRNTELFEDVDEPSSQPVSHIGPNL